MKKFKFLLFALLVIFLAYSLYFKGKALPNVYVGDVNVSGMNKGEIESLLEAKTSDFSNRPLPIFVEDGSKREEIGVSLSDVGISYENSKTAEKLYSTGRSGGFLRSVIFRLRAPFAKVQVEPVYRVDASAFTNTINTKLANYLSPASDATIVNEPGKGFRVVAEKQGRMYNRELLVDLVRNKVETFGTNPVSVQFETVAPEVPADKTQKALEKAKTLSRQRVVLTFDKESWTISSDNLTKALRFVPLGFGDEQSELYFGDRTVELVSISIGDSGTTQLDVSLDKNFLDTFIGDIQKTVDVDKVDAKLTFDGQKVTQFTPARDGQKLNADLTSKLILSKVTIQNPSGDKELAINLPVGVEKAKIENDEINSLGIKELIGKGISYFAGSIPNRSYNIGLASGRINGTIVKKGEVFSFNKTVGEISGATGYKQAYVISAGRTVLDDGGGVCQVSTTLFRAALESGLPIVSRTAHAYRVGYYEQRGYKPGFDATVFSPSVDLSFKNDTAHAILVQTIYDAATARLEVDIYGTSDGRKVQMTEPVVSNPIPALPDKFQDDPSLPKGTVKQVDFSAAGATSIFNRKIFKGDTLVVDENFKSVYRPWQAIYLVGTGG